MPSTGRTLLSKCLCQNLFSSLAAKPDISSRHRMRAVLPSGYDAITQSNAATCGKQKGCSHIPPLCGEGVGAETTPCLQPGFLTQVTYKTQGIWTSCKMQHLSSNIPWWPLGGADDKAGDCNLFSHTQRGTRLFLHKGFGCTVESYDCKGKPWNKPHLPRWSGQVTCASQHTLLVGTQKIIFHSNTTSTKKVTVQCCIFKVTTVFCEDRKITGARHDQEPAEG